MSDERTRDQLIGEALVEGMSWSFLTYAGPGRAEGNADRPLANALDYLQSLGHVDAESGNVEAPGGHFARIARYLIFTDDRGFIGIATYKNVAEAIEHFKAAERRYDQWSKLVEEHGDDA